MANCPAAQTAIPWGESPQAMPRGVYRSLFVLLQVLTEFGFETLRLLARRAFRAIAYKRKQFLSLGFGENAWPCRWVIRPPNGLRAMPE